MALDGEAEKPADFIGVKLRLCDFFTHLSRRDAAAGAVDKLTQ